MRDTKNVLLHLIHIYKGMRIFDWFIFIIVGIIKKPDECWFVFCELPQCGIFDYLPQCNPLYDAWAPIRTILRQLNSDASRLKLFIY